MEQLLQRHPQPEIDLAEKWLEMHRLYTDPEAGPAALMAKEKEMISIRDRLTLRRAQAMIDARSILTPEQMQRLDVMVMSHYGGGMGRMGQGMTAGQRWAARQGPKKADSTPSEHAVVDCMCPDCREVCIAFNMGGSHGS